MVTVAYSGGCCRPPLADSASRMPPVPGHRAPGSMEKIKLSCGQGMHPSRKTLELYYFRVDAVKSRKTRKMLGAVAISKFDV